MIALVAIAFLCGAALAPVCIVFAVWLLMRGLLK